MLLGEIATYLYMLSSVLKDEDAVSGQTVRAREMKVG